MPSLGVRSPCMNRYIETIFAKNFARNYEKKRIILGTSDAWSTSHLSQRTSKPAYYIVDCRILRQRSSLKIVLTKVAARISGEGDFL